MAELFQTTVANINLHLKAIFAEGELLAEATIKPALIVRFEGRRQVSRSVQHYSLPAILAVGFRVRSARCTQFRHWATARLNEYLVKGFTQNVQDAIDQYRFDRPPKPKGQSGREPLLDFPRGALVHFAVSNSEVFVTTRLKGAATFFLPFNKGDKGAKGNPVNPLGHRTAYLWEEVWARESWLEILGRYLVKKKGGAGG